MLNKQALFISGLVGIVAVGSSIGAYAALQGTGDPVDTSANLEVLGPGTDANQTRLATAKSAYPDHLIGGDAVDPALGVPSESWPPGSDRTHDSQSIIDRTMASYLHDMEALSNAVTWFSNPDGPGGSTEEVETISSKLTGYLPFLSGLDGEQLRNVNEKYGVRMAELAQRIASLTVIAVQITGDASIATAVERIPAFAITSTSSSTTEGMISAIIPISIYK